MFPAPKPSYITADWSPVSIICLPNCRRIRRRKGPSRSRSARLTFGSFLLVLAVIIITSTASVIAIRHIDQTFGELQRLQSVGDLAEDIDRRMNELRLAARDFVTDPGTQSSQIAEAATALSDVLKKTRLELAPEQQDMIDGVTERLATYRTGIERISALINRRADLIVACRRCARSSMPRSPTAPIPSSPPSLFQLQSRISTGAAGAQSRRPRKSPRRTCAPWPSPIRSCARP